MSKQITVTLSDSQVAEINQLMLHMREVSGFSGAVARCIDAGITQLEYRYKHNKVKVQRERENKQLLNQLLREKQEWLAKQQMEDNDVVARD